MDIIAIIVCLVLLVVLLLNSGKTNATPTQPLIKSMMGETEQKR